MMQYTVFLVFSLPLTSAFTSSSCHELSHQRQRLASSKLLSLQAITNAADDTVGEVEIRDWKAGEGKAIIDLLRSADDGSFNPEGSLDLDCQTESLLKESYDSDDGGCFVVAELNKRNHGENNDDTIVGVAGLIVGTPVEYQTSGASMSSAQTTAAIRRCCYRRCLTSTDTSTGGDAASVLTQLLTTLEERAIKADATQLIALAYPPTAKGTTTTTTTTNDRSKTIVERPTPQLLEKLGYELLPQQLPGVEALQYGKSLLVQRQANRNEAAVATANTGTYEEEEVSAVAGSAVIAIGALGFFLGGLLSVAQLIGFDTTTTITGSFIGPGAEMDIINRGLGKPLSSEDLSQLLQDEKLQRKSLDGDGGTTTTNSRGSSASREWKDLSLEEQREEMALLQIINGQDVRIK